MTTIRKNVWVEELELELKAALRHHIECLGVDQMLAVTSSLLAECAEEAEHEKDWRRECVMRQAAQDVLAAVGRVQRNIRRPAPKCDGRWD